jgi:hypothetical protein
VNNYGTTFPEAFMDSADVHVSTEDSEANLLNNIPSTVGYEFMWKFPATRFAHLIRSGTQANLQAVLAASVQRHAGYVYVAEDSFYHTQPSFWAIQRRWLGGDRWPPPEITGSKGANAALGSLIAQLASLGLIQDKTT